MGIFSGLIFYQEYRNFDTVRTVGFILGCLINLLGVYVIAQRKNFAQRDTAITVTSEGGSVPSTPVSVSPEGISRGKGSGRRNTNPDLEQTLLSDSDYSGDGDA